MEPSVEVQSALVNLVGLVLDRAAAPEVNANSHRIGPTGRRAEKHHPQCAGGHFQNSPDLH